MNDLDIDTGEEWKEHAVCRGLDPDIFFFGIDNRYRKPNIRKIERARTICNQCPVRTECLQAALDGDEYGFWGGTTDNERRTMRRTPRRRVPEEHGTDTGYQQHRRAGTDACLACLAAHAVHRQFHRPSRAQTA